MSTKIALNEKFSSFVEFDEEFKIYCDNKFEIFSKAASRFVKDELSQYEYVEYKYLHWRKPEAIQSRPTGVRPIQSYHAFNCSAEIRITRKKRENNQYVNTKCNLEHVNHRQCEILVQKLQYK
ncbi:hypothetical protein BpHYR1_006335 [Brachionus plicatilis]|uniref:FAR1 domain-containing protein n=1 Tax=Brachionus plicatilis TaxID=10195 RepID=A0A3M7RI15_BRAPC|nr:hypothetical protein BpHYR1_006335 [Brachionus plicatilis]